MLELGGAARVGRQHPPVVGRVRGQPFDVRADGHVRGAGGENPSREDRAVRRFPHLIGERVVFEVVGRFGALRVDARVQPRRGGGQFADGRAVDRRRRQRFDCFIQAEVRGVGVRGPQTEMVGHARRQARDVGVNRYRSGAFPDFPNALRTRRRVARGIRVERLRLYSPAGTYSN